MSSNRKTAPVNVIGIDIGKNSFHVVGQDQRGAIVLRQKWSRGQVEARLANIPSCLIGMEACVGAHHLSRKLHTLRPRHPDNAGEVCTPIFERPKKRLPGCGGHCRGGSTPHHEVRRDKNC
jgi:hypothetical protein